MKILLWISVACLHTMNIVSYATDAPKFEFIVQEMIRALKLYQVTIFTSSMTNTIGKAQDLFIRSFANQVPTMTVDLTDSSASKRSLEMPVFRKARSSTMYVILQNEESNATQVHNILNNVARISPVSARPKCVSIVFSDNDDSDALKYKISNILHYAWTLKFLDFTILKVSSANDILCFNYNPFTKAYSEEYLETSSDIFPDKLINVNKYIFNLSVFDTPPYLTVQEKGNHKIEIGGINAAYVKTFAKKMNFELKFTIEQDQDLSAAGEDSFVKMENNQINMQVSSLYYPGRYYDRKLTLGYPLVFSKFVAIVPILPISEVTSLSDVLVYILYFSVIMCSFFALAHSLKFQSNQWSMSYIFQTLLGMTIPQPKRNVERIIFFSLVILSMLYSTDLLLKLTSIKLVHAEQDFLTFEDLIKSGMPIYTRESVDENEDIETRKFLSKNLKIESEARCVDLLMSSGNVVCISPYNKANYLVQKNSNTNGMSAMKITGLSFRHEYYSFVYEKASPFADRIEIIFRLLFEAGISIVCSKAKVNTESSNTTDTFFIILILSIGYSLATIIFIFELVYLNVLTQLKIKYLL